MKASFVLLNGVEHVRLEPDPNSVILRPAGEQEKAQFPHEYAAFKAEVAPKPEPKPEAIEAKPEPKEEPEEKPHKSAIHHVKEHLKKK